MCFFLFLNLSLFQLHHEKFCFCGFQPSLNAKCIISHSMFSDQTAPLGVPYLSENFGSLYIVYFQKATLVVEILLKKKKKKMSYLSFQNMTVN